MFLQYAPVAMAAISLCLAIYSCVEVRKRK